MFIGTLSIGVLWDRRLGSIVNFLFAKRSKIALFNKKKYSIHTLAERFQWRPQGVPWFNGF
jgi:hypothetical protein